MMMTAAMLKPLSVSPFNLPDVKAFLNPSEEEKEEQECGGYTLGKSAEKYHDAGYDAFITGLCFIAMANRLQQLRSGGKDTRVTSFADSALLQPFLNKLFLMRVVDINYMNLAAPDVIPDRDHVFHVTFPAEWKTTDLLHLFSPFGSVLVSWLTDTTAFVSLKDHPASAKMVLPTLNCSSVYSIVPYKQYKDNPNAALPGQPSRSFSTFTGITPTLERVGLFEQSPAFSGSANGDKRTRLLHVKSDAMAAKKRSASPVQPEGKKRNKSATDHEEQLEANAKAFDEPPWE